ncbi:MAG: AMP-binding protein [Eubacteriaceae bacterium]
MNISSVVKENNKNNGMKLALSITMDNGEKRAYTYAQLDEKVEIFANKLLSINIFSGDRIALIAENSPEWIISYLAILKIQCSAVLIDSTLSQDEILQLLNKSDVRCIFMSPKIIGKLEKNLSKEVPVLNLLNNGESFHNYPSTIALSIPKTTDGDNNIATILYSSGTTRTAAGIMHTHEALIKSTLMCAKSNKLTSDTKFLAIIPNSHIYGLICSVLGPMLISADVHFIESINSDAVISAFTEYKPTIFPCVPKVFQLFKTQIMRKIESEKKTKTMFHIFFPICLNLRRRFGLNLGKLIFKSIHKGFGGKIEILCSAGAPMDSETAEFYFGTGFNMLITYGATETNIPTIGNRGSNLTTDSCGKPYPDVTVKLNDLGELLIKSPYMMKGYFRDKQTTSDAFEDGWFKTGDLGVLDKNGNYKVVGRCKENIVLSTGKKVTPDDVERKYIGIKGIDEFVVCGVPTVNGSHDEIHAFVVHNKLKYNLDKILKDIQEKGSSLSQYMKITKVHFVDDIVKTSLQKPKRYLLKKLAMEKNLIQTEKNASQIKMDLKDVESEIINLIGKVAKIDSSMIFLNSKLFSELGVDSLSILDLSLQIEDNYGVRLEEHFSGDIAISDIINLIKFPYETTIKTDDSSIYPKEKKHADYALFKHISVLVRTIYNVTVKNDKVIPDNSGYIICSNHVSYFDYLWLSVNFKKERFFKFSCMAKNEIFNKSFVSKRLSQVCGMIPINRGNANISAMNCCKNKLKEKWGLLIHPEGTRSDNGKLGSFKKGAAVLAIESNVPIIPAYIKGAYEIYPKGKKLPNLFNFKKMKKLPVEVTYGDPIFPSNLTVEELIKKVELSILTLQTT